MFTFAKIITNNCIKNRIAEKKMMDILTYPKCSNFRGLLYMSQPGHFRVDFPKGCKITNSNRRALKLLVIDFISAISKND